MQRPTLENVRIRSARDAMHVFHAVARNVLPLITRRLDADERRSIVAGNVYVWEERAATTEDVGVNIGMERWTDGISWSPSRVRDGFLFYHQKEVENDPETPLKPWALLMRSGGSQPKDGPGRLVKQTYSVYVLLPADRMRKWHLTAYFTQEDLDEMRTVESLKGVGDVPVPENIYRSARTSKSRRGGESVSLPTVSSPTSTAPTSTPVSPSSPGPMYQPRSPYSPSSSCSGITPTHTYMLDSPHSPSDGPLRSSPFFDPGFSRERDLVPLHYLQHPAHKIQRDPTDERQLRRLSGRRS